MNLINKEEPTYTIKLTEKELGTIIGAVGSGLSLRIKDICEEKSIKHLPENEEVWFYDSLCDLVK